MVAKALIGVLLGLISSWSFAEVDRGVDAYEQNKHSVALRYWIPLARNGNARAQNNLGVMYQRGLGVAKNFQKALDKAKRRVEREKKAKLREEKKRLKEKVEDTTSQ